MVDTQIKSLAIDGAVVRKRGRQIIGPISLNLSNEGRTIVVGPNGAGKSTLLRLMHGLDHSRQGLTEWTGYGSNIRERQAFVFQHPILLRRSVADNICYPMTIGGWTQRDARAQADLWLSRVGLDQMADKEAAILSGGERQKLAVARALVMSPEVLFLDEPTANLDGASTLAIESLLHDAGEAGTWIIMATHDMGQARRLAQNIVFLHNGLVEETGAADSFFNQPKTSAAAAFICGDIVL